MDELITPIPFRLFDITDVKIYLYGVTLDKITFRFDTMLYPNKPTKRIIFHLKECLFDIAKSHLLNIEPRTIISIIYGDCKDPRIYVESQVIAIFFINRIFQIDICNSIMARSSQEVSAQIGVHITEEGIKNIFNSMDSKNA